MTLYRAEMKEKIMRHAYPKQMTMIFIALVMLIYGCFTLSKRCRLMDFICLAFICFLSGS